MNPDDRPSPGRDERNLRSWIDLDGLSLARTAISVALARAEAIRHVAGPTVETVGYYRVSLAGQGEMWLRWVRCLCAKHLCFAPWKPWPEGVGLPRCETQGFTALPA